MTLASDPELIARIAAGDPRAFERLYARHSPTAVGLAARICGALLAPDAVQEAFLSIWQHAPEYNPARGSGSSWLFSVVRHRAIDARRRAQVRDRTLAAAELRELPSLFDSPTEREVMRRDEATQVRVALRTLPQGQCIALGMAYFEGLSSPEIALKTEAPLGTVKGRIRLGKEKLERALTSV